MKIVFSHDLGRGPTRVHLDLMPLTLEKQPAATNPRRWPTGALVALSVATAARHRATP